jgi:DUF1680 family protein
MNRLYLHISLVALTLLPLSMRADNAEVNVAPQCSSLQASYTSSWNYLYAVYDGTTGNGELDGNKTWGSWSDANPDHQWLTYGWATKQVLSGASVWFWADSQTAGSGVMQPKDWRLEYYDHDSNTWKNVSLTAGQSYGTSATGANQVAFDAVTTDSLRLWMDASNSGTNYSGLGVTEWEVYGHSAEGTRTTYGDYPITGVPFNDVKVDDSFWSFRIKQNQETTIPIALQRCIDAGRLDNFKKAAGLMSGYFVGENTFDDTDIYKIIEGMAYSYQAMPQQWLSDEMDTLIYYIALAQEPDGYLMTARTAGEPGNLHPWLGAERWTEDPNLSHELYCQGHLYEAAVAHYLATGKHTLLNVAIKSADLLVKDFLEGGLAYEPGHQIVEMALVKLYRVTGNEKYLRLAQYFLDLRGVRGVSRDTYNQTYKPVVQQGEAVGHAVRAAYMYSGMADVAAIMGDERYVQAIDKIWNNVVGKKLYLTGGIGALHSNEGFGDNYVLPNESGYCETCASIGNVYWNHRMFQLHGDSKYYDIIERTLYNGVLSGISLSGDHFFYPNPLESSGSYGRSEWFGCACCPSNLCRFMASVPGYVYAHRGDSVYVNLYMQDEGSIPVSAQDTMVLRQITQYPWQGDVSIRVERSISRPSTLMLRLPGWAAGQPVASDLYSYVDARKADVVVKVNGQPVNYQMSQGYMAITRQWNEGDVVSFSLPMTIRRVVANDNVSDDRGKVALERGPIVYCLESEDNGNLSNLYIPDDAQVDTLWTDDLKGVMTLDIKGRRVSTSGSEATTSEEDLVAIPYYAWDNRSVDAMKVWVPRDSTLAERPAEVKTMEVSVVEKPFSEYSGGSYYSEAVTLDKAKVCSLLGIAEDQWESLCTTRVSYAAVEPDGSLNTNSTANAPGHWFGADGSVVSWGNGSYVFSELNLKSLTFNVGQYPYLCQSGEVYHFAQALTYTPASSDEKAVRLVIRFTLTIDDNPTAVELPKANKTSDEYYYDLTGRRVSHPVHGVYIKGGHKYVVR